MGGKLKFSISFRSRMETTLQVPIPAVGSLTWAIYKEDDVLSHLFAAAHDAENQFEIPDPLYSNPADTELPSSRGWIVGSGQEPAPTLELFPIERRLSYSREH